MLSGPGEMGAHQGGRVREAVSSELCLDAIHSVFVENTSLEKDRGACQGSHRRLEAELGIKFYIP